VTQVHEDQEVLVVLAVFYFKDHVVVGRVTVAEDGLFHVKKNTSKKTRIADPGLPVARRNKARISA
jgi:hypothetical protein